MTATFPFAHACAEPKSEANESETKGENQGWHEVAQKLLDQLLPQLQPLSEQQRRDGLGFLYLHDSYSPAAGAILSHIKAISGIEHLTGTVGLGILAGRREYLDQAAMALMFCPWSADQYRLIPPTHKAPVQCSDEQRDWAQQHAYNVAIIHGDPRNPEVPAIIQRLDETLPAAFAVGGLSSSDHAYPQFADGLHSGGLSGVCLSDSVALSTGLSQGVSPISEPMTVSESVKNVLLRIGSEKALPVIASALGHDGSEDPDWNALFSEVLVGLKVGGSDTGDYQVRPIVGIDPAQGMIAISDAIEPGQSLFLCRRDQQSAHDDLIRMVDQCLARAAGQPLRGALYFSCLGRGREMFGDPDVELSLIQDRLRERGQINPEMDELPLLGFFANGEISHNRLYGFTGVLTLFF